MALAFGAGALGFAATVRAADVAAPAASAVGLQPCRLPGVEHAARCGRLERPLDPADAASPRITIRWAVLPALARRPAADPLVFFAGGPGQGAVDLADRVQALLARFGARRDLVLVDLRGTGGSAPLDCPALDDPQRPLAEALDARRSEAALRDCRAALARTPAGDLTKYGTALAVQDVEAVRAALGIERWNLVGVSYGTRAALEYLRQFPQRVRRVVLDGVAPPDMVLPLAAGVDSAAAFDALDQACRAEPACAARHGALRPRLEALLATLPREFRAVHPLSGTAERVVLDREALLGLLRAPLYAPALAAGLPEALVRASDGDATPLLALASALGAPGAAGARLAEALHFSVICAEDALPAASLAAPPDAAAQAALFGSALADRYRRICADWPRAAPPAAFRTIPPAPVAVLLLSGGADPATPPRHAERTARALGPKARAVTVGGAGHGTLALPCVRDLVFRFVDAPDDGAALAAAADCPAALPAPRVFVPPAAATGVAR